MLNNSFLSQTTTTIVFIDSSVSNYQTLQTGVVDGVETVILSPNKDGIKEISEFLGQHPQITTIHIVSHGSPGCLYLGNAQLNLDNISKYADLLRHWQRQSIFLYGCNVAAGDAGEEFISKLHEITTATISASATKTGNTALGGNWQLETTLGKITSNQAFTAAAKANYAGVFGAAPVLMNKNFTVNEGSSIIVTNSMLRTTDIDNTDAQLIYTLKSLPANGTLRLNGINLAVNGTFSQDDINNSRITYIHNGSETINDSFNFIVTDGDTTTTRLSTDAAGTQGNSDSYNPTITPDGRYVVFDSYADNLVSGDTNGSVDVFIKDLTTNSITRISTAANGTQGNGFSYSPAISADGRYVVFISLADNLVSGDTNGAPDVFVKNLTTNSITRISTAAVGTQGNSDSYNPAISADGRYVVFNSYADNLVSGDTNGAPDIFVKNLTTNSITRISTAADGTQGNNDSGNPSVSADGRYVVFNSNADNLVSGDTNGATDVFVKDLTTNSITRISTTAVGTQGNSDSYNPAISADGRYVVFNSNASNLVSGDTNGTDDVFVKNLTTNSITRVSTAAVGTQGNGSSSNPAISSDGRYVVFNSNASNLVSGDTNGTDDVFVKDLTTSSITRLSNASDGSGGNNSSYEPGISSDGRSVVFWSYADNLVSGDINGFPDVFLSTPRVISGSTSIIVTPVNDAPVITTTSTALSYIENATTAIDSAIIVSDVDSAKSSKCYSQHYIWFHIRTGFPQLYKSKRNYRHLQQRNRSFIFNRCSYSCFLPNRFTFHYLYQQQR